MKLHKAGYSVLLKLFVLLVLLDAVLLYFIDHTTINYIILGATGIFYLLCVNFFRFPHRNILVDNNTILAPADGKVVVIEETEENEYFKDKRLQVSIFMNVFNVHINWFPINGKVIYFQYHKGKFSAAYLPKSSTENERTSIVIKNENGEAILMRQIAGAMAKRIVSYAPVGEEAKQDKHAGFIKFGSRVDLYLPLDTHINVKLGQKTVGSQTIIGTFTSIHD
ncbi:phosphatidylserine decarboxylase family protein [Odoribacter sp. OttesenSCG-928-G04]|nr:phosphatidylserine decarboxylase family protein [Odoribacter sp. OttesenSCG-928-G04]